MRKRLVRLLCMFIAISVTGVVANADPTDSTSRGGSITVGTNATILQNEDNGKDPRGCSQMTLASLASHIAHATGIVAQSGNCSCAGTPCGVTSNSCSSGTRPSCTRIPFDGCSCDCE